MVGAVIALAFSLLMLGTTEVITMQGAFYEALTWAVRWGIARNIVWAWILTIPAAATIAWFSFLVIRYFVPGA